MFVLWEQLGACNAIPELLEERKSSAHKIVAMLCVELLTKPVLHGKKGMRHLLPFTIRGIAGLPIVLVLPTTSGIIPVLQVRSFCSASPITSRLCRADFPLSSFSFSFRLLIFRSWLVSTDSTDSTHSTNSPSIFSSLSIRTKRKTNPHSTLLTNERKSSAENHTHGGLDRIPFALGTDLLA